MFSLAQASKGMRVGADPEAEKLLLIALAIASGIHLAVRFGWIRTKHEGRWIAAALAAILLMGLLIGGVRIPPS